MKNSEIERLIHQMELCDQLSSDDFTRIDQWSQSSDVYIRDRIASMLGAYPNQQSEEILLRLAQDKDSLVRADAFDSLSSFPSLNAQRALKQATVTEPDSLARSYAILSYADVMTTEKSSDTLDPTFFDKLLEKEESPRCRLSCYYALSFCGKEASIDHILSYLSHADYRIRCTAISILQEVANSKNTSKIRVAVRVQREIDPAAAVKDKIDELLAVLEQLENEV